MIRRLLVLALALSSIPCLAVDLRGTTWYGDGQMTVTLSGQSQSQPFASVIAFTGNSPKKGYAALTDIACKWTSSSLNSPAFTLVPLSSSAQQLAAALQNEIPGATVRVKGLTTRGSASLQTGIISYGVKFSISIKQGRTKLTGYATLSQYGYQIAAAATPAARDELLPRIQTALERMLRK